jgi:TolB protein
MRMNEDGTFDTDTTVRLTNNAHGDGFPALSPDGKKIVFDTNRLRLAGEPINTNDLFVMNTDGTEQTHLIRGSTASWSPDGKYIAFHRSASGKECLVPDPRTPPTVPTPGCPIKTDPGAATWDSDIFIANVDDLIENVEDSINITNSLLYIDDDPDWSPDGKKIVFTRHLVSDDQMNSITAEICVLDLETPNAETHCLASTNNNIEERAPAWSPDGTRIAYMCRIGNPNPQNPQGPTFEICVINYPPDGSEPTRLTTNTVFEGSPKWSPDGQQILFHRPVMGRQQLFVMNADGH